MRGCFLPVLSGDVVKHGVVLRAILKSSTCLLWFFGYLT